MKKYKVRTRFADIGVALNRPGQSKGETIEADGFFCSGEGNVTFVRRQGLAKMEPFAFRSGVLSVDLIEEAKA